MELQKVDKMIKKYLEGKTSLQEEKELRAYFSSDSVAPQYEEYKLLFSFFAEEKEQTYEMPQKIFKKKKHRSWIGIAAGMAILLGVFIFGPKPQKDSGVIKDPEIAMQKTKEVLHFIAMQMNQGKQDLVYLSQIQKTKNKILK